MSTHTFKHVDYLWDEAHAQSKRGPSRTFLYRSNLLGADLRITNYGGGNTSCKTIEKDPLTNEYVKSCGLKVLAGISEH